MRIELRIALDCFNVLTVDIEARTDFGIRIETFSIWFVGIAGVVSHCCPARFPVHPRSCVRCAVKISRGDPSMGGGADFWCRCFDHDRKQRDAVLLNADHRDAWIVATTHSATHLVTPELCLFWHIPLRFPSAISRKRRVSFTNNPAAVAFFYGPVHRS